MLRDISRAANLDFNPYPSIILYLDPRKFARRVGEEFKVFGIGTSALPLKGASKYYINCKLFSER